MSYSINSNLDNKMSLTQNPFPDPKISRQMFFFIIIIQCIHYFTDSIKVAFTVEDFVPKPNCSVTNMLLVFVC